MDVWKRFGEKEVSHSMVHYLQAVAAIKTEKGYARVSDVALRLGVSRSGVTSMMQTLHARGLVNHERYGCVELTAAGGRLAKRTESSRHVLTVFLTEMLNVPEAVAQEDACMIEHLVSPEVMLELVCLTGFMRSDHPAALAFREAYLRHPRGCAETASGDCDLCGGACLHDSLTKEIQCETGVK